ncbi:MAG: sulfite exporter TauE/SafE family protein [Chloroflexi bacterium]|nr:sulfite exporter TauE/SafE family protein [Chloroflexota bacterium]
MLWLALLGGGLFAGAYGALIGAGGGFLLVPFLLFLFPDRPAGVITGISLAAVFITAASSSVIYARQRRIDYPWAVSFAVTGIPGMALGGYAVTFLSRSAFQTIFGVVLLLLAIYLLVRPVRFRRPRPNATPTQGNAEGISLLRRLPGALLGFGIGFAGGLLGIGGGILLVPAAIQLLGLAPHIATATSQLNILLTSPAALLVRGLSLEFVLDDLKHTAVLGIGTLVGAQFGARLSPRVSGPLIIRLLAIGLALVAVRLLWPTT